MFQFEIEDPTEPFFLEDEDEFKIGDRIISENDFGIIHYIGEVKPHPGIWLGIEWDRTERGKHNGDVGGIQYFNCAKQNSASFVRPHKAKKVNDIVSVFLKRYGYDPIALENLKQIDERLGMIRIDLNELRLVDLSLQKISDLGNGGEFVAYCPNLVTFDLANNLITSWGAIAEICRHLPKLKVLNVSKNPLAQVTNVEDLGDAFKSLEHVILGEINYDWNNVLNMSSLWPQVKNLQLQFNVISGIIPPETCLIHLTSLDLEQNQISSWDEVMKLNVCKGLQYINLGGNKIEKIRFPINSDSNKNLFKTEIFPNLTRLILSENRIPDWLSVSELNKLPKLAELRIEFNPFLDRESKNNNRQLVIARIAGLEKLEGGEINRQERRDAELDYVKKFSREQKLSLSDPKFVEEHPRYLELVQKFGESQEGEISTTLKTMQSTFINLEFEPEDPSFKPYSKSLMPNMTVQKLKMLIQRNYRLKTSRIEIKVVSKRNPGVTFVLENEFYDLTQYSVENGDKLLLKW